MKYKYLIIYLCLFTSSFLMAASISDVIVYGAFETAGINIKIDNYSLDRTENAKIFYKKSSDSEYQEGHYFVWYDGNHMATSLFDLDLATTYDLKIELYDSLNVLLDTKIDMVTTKPEFSIPVAVRVVNVGTSAELNAAINDAQPGDHILVASGEYFDSVHVYQTNGTFENPIVISAQNTSDKPLFWNRVMVEKSSYVYLDNLEVSDTSGGKIERGVVIRGSYNTAITNCYVHDCSWKYSTNILIEHADESEQTGVKYGNHLIMNNVIGDNDQVIFGNNYRDYKTYYGIKCDYQPGGRIIIRGNTIYGVTDGISSGGNENDKYPELTDENVLDTYWNQELDIYDNIIYDCEDDCIETDGFTVNGRIFRNRLGKCTNSISTAAVMPGPYFMVRNYINNFKENSTKFNRAGEKETRNIFYYHNTIVKGNDAKRVVYRGEPAQTINVTFKNNILYAEGLSGEAGRDRIFDADMYDTGDNYHINHIVDNDLMFSNGSPGYFKWATMPGNNQKYNTLADFQTGTLTDFGVMHEENGIWAKPDLDQTALFGLEADKGIKNYKLLPGSRGIDEAVLIPGINHNYEGNAPDIGAYETSMAVIGDLVPPSNLSTGSITQTTIELTWNDNSTQEAGVIVERSVYQNEEDAVYEIVATLGADAVEYQDTMLTESTKYFYRVSAFNATDTTEASDFVEGLTEAKEDDGKSFQEADGIISFEAENYDGKENKSGANYIFTKSPEGYSGNGLMVVLPDTGLRVFGVDPKGEWIEKSPRLDFRINVKQAGKLYVWLHANTGDDQTKDSWHVGLNGIMDTTGANIATYSPNGYEWFNMSVWNGSGENATKAFVDVETAGEHVFNLYVREDGAPIDKIVLSTDPSYVPTGLGPDESGRLVVNVSESLAQLPTTYGLEQNYPNPFNPTTLISFSLPKASQVSVDVYNTLGQKVATLVNNDLTAGVHNVSFDAGNFTSGVYFYTLRAGDYVSTKKMLLIK